MKTFSRSCWLLIPALVCGGPTPMLAQETQSGGGLRRAVGAPQVLEIPAQEMSAPVDSPAQPEFVPTPDEQALGVDDLGQSGSWQDTPPPLTSYQRTYLGVLYATAEEGPMGVKVLSVVEGSPADRAGFQGVDTPSEGHSGLFKAAIVVLAMSPAGPFAIPLAIAHDLYTNRHPPGDLIVAVNNQPVRDAQGFSDMLRSYQPGDTVSFSVVRGGKPLEISVQLEEEPL